MLRSMPAYAIHNCKHNRMQPLLALSYISCPCLLAHGTVYMLAAWQLPPSELLLSCRWQSPLFYLSAAVTLYGNTTPAMRASPFVPVTELMLRGRVRMSMMCGVCTHGTRKCVPSPTTSGRIPLNLSKMTARSPPSTAVQQQATTGSKTQQPASITVSQLLWTDSGPVDCRDTRQGPC